MARFLITCWPFTGHVFHGINIGRALRERRHECAFYSGPRAARLFADEGFAFFPFEKLDDEAVYSFVFKPNRERSVKDTLKFARTIQSLLVDTVPRQVADIEPILASWKPDVLVDDGSILGPLLVVWEKHKIPLATLDYFGCVIPGPDVPPFGLGLPPPRNWYTRLLAKSVTMGTYMLTAGIRGKANEIRGQHGLPPLTGSINEFSAKVPLHLVLNTPELDYNRRDLPSTVRYAGPCCLWNRPRHEQSADWLQQLPRDKPWVHATEGTLHFTAPIVLRAAAQGLANLPMEAILTGGTREPSELDLGPIASNVHVVRWVSHIDLLPLLDVMVTTGGAANVKSALASGVPLIIVPTEWDKPEIARRVEDSGAGLRLLPRHCTPRRMREAVEHVLHTPSYRRNAQRIAGIFAKYEGSATAAKLLEELATKHIRADL
jgi:UDP:flavonoid glycosyltransferase YjiC (YdhE family)